MSEVFVRRDSLNRLSPDIHGEFRPREVVTLPGPFYRDQQRLQPNRARSEAEEARIRDIKDKLRAMVSPSKRVAMLKEGKNV